MVVALTVELMLVEAQIAITPLVQERGELYASSAEDAFADVSGRAFAQPLAP
jgi:hypothetical protein